MPSEEERNPAGVRHRASAAIVTGAGDTFRARATSGEVLRYRGGALYHPRAEEHYLALREEFGERLEITSAQFAKQEGVETVHHKHVTRAYDSLVTREAKRRVGEKVADILIGASISGLIALFFEMARSSAALTPNQLWILAGLILLLALSVAYSSWSLRR